MQNKNRVLVKHAVTFLAGAIFALGLLISGMANPNKVLAFLDVTGVWDPSLIFVMMGAIPVAYIAFRFTKNSHSTVLGEDFYRVKKKEIDSNLIVGSALFGIGWGLSGICPGPAIVLLGLNIQNGFVFFTALAIGMLAFEFLLSRNKTQLKLNAKDN